MSNLVVDKAPAASVPQRPLAQARLPRWAPAGIAAASIAIGAGIGLGAGLDSKIQWGLDRKSTRLNSSHVD